MKRFISEAYRFSDRYCDDLFENMYYFFAGLPRVNSENYNIIINKFVDVVKNRINMQAPITKLSRRDYKFKLKHCYTKGKTFQSKRDKNFIFYAVTVSGLKKWVSCKFRSHYESKSI